MKLTTGQVLTITTGKLACEMGEVYEALDGLTGDSLMTHQLPRASEYAKPHVEKACPWSTDVPALVLDESDREGSVKAWIAGISEEVGEVHEVPDLSEDWEARDPIAELVEMMGE